MKKAFFSRVLLPCLLLFPMCAPGDCFDGIGEVFQSEGEIHNSLIKVFCMFVVFVVGIGIGVIGSFLVLSRRMRHLKDRLRKTEAANVKLNGEAMRMAKEKAEDMDDGEENDSEERFAAGKTTPTSGKKTCFEQTSVAFLEALANEELTEDTFESLQHMLNNPDSTVPRCVSQLIISTLKSKMSTERVCQLYGCELSRFKRKNLAEGQLLEKILLEKGVTVSGFFKSIACLLKGTRGKGPGTTNLKSGKHSNRDDSDTIGQREVESEEDKKKDLKKGAKVPLLIRHVPSIHHIIEAEQTELHYKEDGSSWKSYYCVGNPDRLPPYITGEMVYCINQYDAALHHDDGRL